MSGYIAGTTTPKLLFSNRTDCINGTNGTFVITLPTDASMIIWIDDSVRTKLVLADSTGATLPNGTIDNIIGEFDLTGSSLTLGGVLNLAQGANIASASTTPIGAATGNFILITGTTTINAFDTVQAGAERVLEFQSSLTITYNASSLILPGLASIVTAAGDVATFISLGSGNWFCTGYQRATGEILLNRSAGTIASATTTNLASVSGNLITISGTTTITSFGTLPAGVTKYLQFSGICTVTYNATSMIIPGGVSYTSIAGDIVTAESLGSGNWQLISIPASDISNFNKSATLASATTTDLSTVNADSITVSGTTTITALGTLPAGVKKYITFSGSLLLTQNGTSLILPGATNIQTLAGDAAIFVSLGSGNWKCIDFLPASGTVLGGAAVGAAVRDIVDPTKLVKFNTGGITTANTRTWTIPDSSLTSFTVQRVSTVTGAYASGTTTMALANVIPVQTAGNQFMSLAITPQNVNNILVIDVYAILSPSTSVDCVMALFQDATSNAVATGGMILLNAASTHPTGGYMRWIMAAGTTSSTTFKVRAGLISTGTTYFNGNSTSQIAGGSFSSYMMITEYSS